MFMYKALSHWNTVFYTVFSLVKQYKHEVITKKSQRKKMILLLQITSMLNSKCRVSWNLNITWCMASRGHNAVSCKDLFCLCPHDKNMFIMWTVKGEFLSQVFRYCYHRSTSLLTQHNQETPQNMFFNSPNWFGNVESVYLL